MPPTAKKISTVAEIGTIADEDYVPTIDVSAATPAAKGVRATYAKIAAYILSKFPVPSQATAEAGAETVARLWTAERVKQAIDAAIVAALSGGGITNNAAANRAPLGTDDISASYTFGSLWRWDLRVWICVANATNIASWVELTGTGSGLTNPMTTPGDLIIGGEGGAPARLAKGANGLVLKMVAGAVEWAADATSEGGITDPTTAAGDLIVRGASALARLPIGVDGKLLGVVSGALAYVDAPDGGEASLPVVDTVALVKDPVDATKLLRIDAGNVPVETTVVLQSPGVSAVVGVQLIERAFSGAPLQPGTYYPGFVVNQPGLIVSLHAWVTQSGGNTYPVVLRLRKNSNNIGPGPMHLNIGDATSIFKYNSQAMSVGVASGDYIDITVEGSGAEDVGGSGTSGNAYTGVVTLQIGYVQSPS